MWIESHKSYFKGFAVITLLTGYVKTLSISIFWYFAHLNKLIKMATVKDKTCIITGSAAGLGKAYAAKLLQNGTRVCLSDVNEDAGAKTLAEFQETFGEDRVFFVRCDVIKQEEFVNLFDEAEKAFGVKCIDILVNNAGINNNLGWRKCFDVNIYGVMIGMEIAMERMTKSPGKGTLSTAHP